MSSREKPELPFAPRLDSVEDWLASLPVRNARECCRILYAGLQALNASELEASLYFQALEKFRPLIFLQARNLEAFFLGKPFPLDEKVRKLAKLSAQFHAELANGYQALARQARFAELFGVEERARILHRSLQSFNLFLLRLAQVYETPSPSIWERLNELYRLAEQADVLQCAVHDADTSPYGASNIADLFRCILTFRLAAPNRLSQVNIQRLFELLQQYGHLIHLGRSPVEQGSKAEFFVDLDSGHAPCSLARAHGGNPLYLFHGAFVEKLAVLSQPTVPEHSRLKKSLSVYLQVRLGGMPPFSPEQKSRNAVLVLGFDALIKALAGIGVGEEGKTPWRSMTELDLVPLSEHMDIHREVVSSKSAGTFIAAAVSKKTVNLPYEGEIWGRPEGEFLCQVYRTEAPGFYLLEPRGVALRPGSLVGLNTDNKSVQVGLVCCGRHERAPSLYGFELLASEVSLVRFFCDSAPQIGHKVLFVKPLSAEEGCSGLIAPPLKLRVGERVSVDLDGRRENYRIAKHLEATVEFSQFEMVREGGVASM